MFKFLRPSPAIDRLPEEKISSTYKRSRMQVFIAIYLGYMIYYFVRMNFIFARPLLTENFGFSKTQVGLIGAV